MRRAARVDRNHAEIRDTLRDLCPVVDDMSHVGGGFPDLLVQLPGGAVVFVEVKDGQRPPSERKLKPGQVAFQRRWGRSYFVITSRDEAIALATRRR